MISIVIVELYLACEIHHDFVELFIQSIDIQLNHLLSPKVYHAGQGRARKKHIPRGSGESGRANQERRASMTLKELEALPEEMLTVDQIAEVIGSKPHSIRIQAQNNPDKLGFPVIVSGTRVRIPKAGFLYFCRFGRPIETGRKETA